MTIHFSEPLQCYSGLPCSFDATGIRAQSLLLLNEWDLESGRKGESVLEKRLLHKMWTIVSAWQECGCRSSWKGSNSLIMKNETNKNLKVQYNKLTFLEYLPSYKPGTPPSVFRKAFILKPSASIAWCGELAPVFLGAMNICGRRRVEKKKEEWRLQLMHVTLHDYAAVITMSW